MNAPKLTLLRLLPLVLLANCKPNYDKIFKDNNNYFERHRIALKKIVDDVEKQYISTWNGQKFDVPLDSLSHQTKIALRDMGIESVEINDNPNDSCTKKYCITLSVMNRWNIESLKVVQLVFAPCDKNASKNYHYYDGYHRDFWGQGDNWFIYSDTDFI